MIRAVILATVFLAATAQAQTCANEPEQPLATMYGWADSGSLWNSPAQLYRDGTCRVHLSGLIYRWGDPAIVQAVKLPASHCPAKDHWFAIAVNGVQTGTAIVRPPIPSTNAVCDVLIFMPMDSAWASLAGVSFKAR